MKEAASLSHPGFFLPYKAPRLLLLELRRVMHINLRSIPSDSPHLLAPLEHTEASYSSPTLWVLHSAKGLDGGSLISTTVNLARGIMAEIVWLQPLSKYVVGDPQL